jgi:PAS domain S-box-containing protein
MPTQLLLVEDNPGDALLLQGLLDTRYPGRYATATVATLGEAKALLAQQMFDSALLDLSLPDSQGLETIGRLAAAAPQLPIVVLTGVDDEAVALEAVRCGAEDYLIKGQTDSATIARAIQYAMDRKQTEERLRAQQAELEAKNRELEEAQRRLEAYRDRYVDLYDFAPLGYVTIDEDGYIQEINLAGAALLGRDREELTGYPLTDYLSESDREAFLHHVRQCCEGHSEVTSVLSLVAPDGQLHAVQIRSIPIETPGDEGVFCKTAIIDIVDSGEKV